jgi:hypothetical protein
MLSKRDRLRPHASDLQLDRERAASRLITRASDAETPRDDSPACAGAVQPLIADRAPC